MSIESLSGMPYQPGTANQTTQSGGVTPLGSGNGNDPPTSTAANTSDTVTISAEATTLLEAEEGAPLQPLGSGSGNVYPTPPAPLGSGNGNDPPKSE